MTRPASYSDPSTARRLLVASVAVLTVLAFGTADAQNIRRGELLYENHCGECHDENVHLREDRRAQSVDEVRGWVASWAVHGDLGWDPDDIADVTLYLSRTLYEFER